MFNPELHPSTAESRDAAHEAQLRELTERIKILTGGASALTAQQSIDLLTAEAQRLREVSQQG